MKHYYFNYKQVKVKPREVVYVAQGHLATR